MTLSCSAPMPGGALGAPAVLRPDRARSFAPAAERSLGVLVEEPESLRNAERLVERPHVLGESPVQESEMGALEEVVDAFFAFFASPWRQRYLRRPASPSRRLIVPSSSPSSCSSKKSSSRADHLVKKGMTYRPGASSGSPARDAELVQSASPPVGVRRSLPAAAREPPRTILIRAEHSSGLRSGHSRPLLDRRLLPLCG